MPDDDRLILPGEGDRAELREKAAKYDALRSAESIGMTAVGIEELQRLRDLRPLCEEMLAALRNTDDALCDIAQLIGGWKTTTPAEEWSEWDERTSQKREKIHGQIVALMVQVEAALKGGE